MKYKILIVDDEPLVQVGIKSMVNWDSLDIEVCGTAVNGSIALDMIDTLHPDIVLTDVKMPVLDGIDMIKAYREKSSSDLPVFIVLTSYEEFGLAKKAISLRAFDYLVKVELTQESLTSTIERALAYIDKTLNSPTSQIETESEEESSVMLRSYTEKFMISLLNNLFESREQLILQAKDINLSFNFKHYICCYGSFETNQSDNRQTDSFSLFNSSLLMVRELAEKYQHCHTISLDISHFALLFCYSTEYKDDELNNLMDALKRIQASLKNYIGINIRCGIGTSVTDPISISESFQYSRLSYRQTDSDTPVVFLDTASFTSNDTFHFSLFQKELTRAYEEYNSDLLRTNINTLCDLLMTNKNHYAQSLDAASNILYMSISLISEGEHIVKSFFSEYSDGYMSLYRQPDTEQIINWLNFLTDNLCVYFDERKKDYKNKIVSDVKSYISTHICEKLTLNEVAAQFGISPSYLSQLFSRYNETGFNEYINICKIKAAKPMLKEGGGKVYEVADALSFGSEFYFSKVFKKIEGISPTEYVNGVHS